MMMPHGQLHVGSFSLEQHGTLDAAEMAAAEAYDAKARALLGEVGSQDGQQYGAPSIKSAGL